MAKQLSGAALGRRVNQYRVAIYIGVTVALFALGQVVIAILDSM